MNLAKNIALFTAGLLVVAAGVWFSLNAVVEGVPLQWYPIIPAVFYIFGIMLIYSVAKSQKEDGRKKANIYMLLKLSKMISTLIAVGLAYWLMPDKEESRLFIVVLVVYYGLFIIFETAYIYFTEKNQKAA